MPIAFDPNKAQANQRKHGVNFDEAASALFDPDGLVRIDPDSCEETRYVLVGLSNKARLLTICYTLRDEEENIRLISARKATQKEANAYARGI